MRKLMLLGLTLVGLYGCGSGDGPVINPPPAPPIARVGTYLLAANRGPGSDGFDVFRVNGGDASLTQVASSPSTGGPLNNLQSTGSFVYVALENQPLIDGFVVDAATGATTRLPGFPIATEIDNNLCLTEDGAFLYAVGETSVDGFSVNPQSGALTRLAGFPLPVPGMTDSGSSEVSPNGDFFFVGDQGTNQIFTFSANPTTGALTLVGASPAAGSPQALQFDPAGQFLLTAEGQGTLESFTVGGGGLLTSVDVEPYAPPGSTSWKLGLRTDLVYVSDAVSNTLNAFRLNQDGTFTPLAGFPVPNGGSSATIYPFFLPGEVLFTFAGNQIFSFELDAAGNVTPVGATPAGSGGGDLLPLVLGF